MSAGMPEDGPKQHPAVELEHIVHQIDRIDEERKERLEQRRELCERAEGLQMTLKDLLETSQKRLQLPGHAPDEEEHFESARYRKDERKSYDPL